MILTLVVAMQVTQCSDTILFDSTYKANTVYIQKVAKLPTSECWQFWPGDTTCKFATVFMDDTTGAAVVVARTTKTNWFPMNVNGDKGVTIADLMLIIGRYLCYLFGRC